MDKSLHYIYIEIDRQKDRLIDRHMERLIDTKIDRQIEIKKG